MRTNVFLRSTRRQPVRALCLALVIVFVSFAFVARASEYLLISQEVERISGYYRSAGILEAAKRQAREDVSAAAAYLADSPYVKQVEQYRYIPAVLQNEVRNADTDGAYSNRDLYFYGTLDSVRASKPGKELTPPKLGELSFSVDTVLAGYPEYIGETAVLRTDRSMEQALSELEVGRRYLIRGSYEEKMYDLSTDTVSYTYTEKGFFLAPLADGAQDGIWYQEVPTGGADFSDARLAGLEETIHSALEDQQTLSLLATRDMSALPEAQAANPSIYLAEGRWLDGEDEAAQARVCVVNASFARLRGLHVGDTLPLELRDAPSTFGYLDAPAARTAQEDYEIVGTYDYVSQFDDTCARNAVYVPASTVPDTFVHGGEYSHQQWWLNQKLGAENGGALPLAGQLAFVLSSPDAEEPFLAESQAELEAMGYEVKLVPVNWEEFQTAVKPMIQSSTFNLAVYTGVLLVALCLIAFVYFRTRRREIAIVRSFGLPVGRCVREASLPLLLLGLAGVLLGGGLGWGNTARTAAETLASLASLDLENGGTAVLPLYWLAVLWAAVFLLLAALTIGTARLQAARPVLAQVQGTGVKAKRTEQRAAAASGSGVQAAQLSFEALHTAAAPRPQSAGRNPRQALRFVWRHIVRSPVKSALAMLLAAGFMAGLAAVQASIVTNETRLDELFAVTQVDLELTQASGTEAASDLGFLLYHKAVEDILDTGMLSDAYLEGKMAGTLYTDRSAWETPDAPGALAVGLQKKFAACTIYGFDCAERFLSELGSGSHMEILYNDGWDASLFAQDWSAQVGRDGEPVIPVIIPRKWSRSSVEQMDEDPDRYVYKAGDTVAVECNGKLQVCVVAGVYSQAASRSAAVLAPASLLEAMGGDRIAYSRARFTVDPAQNRNLGEVRTQLEAITSRMGTGSAPVTLTMWDGELRQAVEPLEDSIELMRLLYPVMVVLSILAAAGVSVLFVMLSAKEAAILRVQGTTKLRTILMLSLQQAFPCFAGLLIGLVGILLYLGGTRPDLLPGIAPGVAGCAAAYLAAGVLGAAASSTAVTNKNPLEMLQVKE